jgi:hypothetical protein
MSYYNVEKKEFFLPPPPPADIERPTRPVNQSSMTREDGIKAVVYRGLGLTYRHC